MVVSLNLKSTSSGNHISVWQITPQGGQWYVHAWTGVRCHLTMPCQTLGGCFDYQASFRHPPLASCFDWSSHTPAELPSPATAVLPSLLLSSHTSADSLGFHCNLMSFGDPSIYHRAGLGFWSPPNHKIITILHYESKGTTIIIFV